MTEQDKVVAAKWVELFQAMAEGKTIQMADCGHWYDLAGASSFDLHKSPSSYRVKPEVKKGKYRVAFTKEYVGQSCLILVETEAEEQRVEKAHYFIKWLTNWVEYTYEEQEQ